MEIIENVISKNMWPTTTYTFTVNNIDNERIKNKIIEREQKGLDFALIQCRVADGKAIKIYSI